MIAALVAVTATLVTLIAAACSKRPAPVVPFAASSPWRQLIPAEVKLHPDSEAMIAAVQGERGLYANLVQYGIPIYTVPPRTNFYSVGCTAYTSRVSSVRRLAGVDTGRGAASPAPTARW